MEWVDISIFISSTFNDMHAERDLLLKKVFPALSEWCAERRIRIYDIDLRWGVTAEESKNRNTVEVCLRNVDNCRPFFLCFLGQRRGWVPTKDGINPDAYIRYPGLVEHIGNDSVTEIEIEHALLAPMLSMVEGRSEYPCISEHSLFFIRNGDYTAQLNDSQRRIFTNADTADEVRTDKEQADFVARVRNDWQDVYDYSCRFDKAIYSSELIPYGDEIAQGRLTDFYIQGTPLDAFIIEALKKEIIKAYPDRAESVSGNIIETESDRQERRAQDIIQGTIDREEIIDRIGAYCTSTGNRPFIIYGQAGSGKSTLLSQYFENHKNEFARSIIRFCGCTFETSAWIGLWEGIREELEIEGIYDVSSKNGLSDLLVAIARHGKTIIIIDGIDELTEGLSVLPYIPDMIPDGISLILSFRSADEDVTLIGELKKNGRVELCEILPFSDTCEMEKMINLYLSQYLKALDDAQIQAICENPAAHNPLFLKIILRELRIFGSYIQVGNQIREYGNDPESAFVKTLADLEKEIAYTGIRPDIFIPNMMGVLALVRGSISIQMLKSCLTELVGEEEEKLSDALAFYRRRLGPYFTWDGEYIGISYASLREGTRNRYSGFAIIQHCTLADAYRDSRPLECLYHLRMAGKADEIHKLSEDIAFLIKAVSTSGALCLLYEMEASVKAYPGCVSEEILSCFRKIAALTGKNGQSTAALLYKELENESLRKQAASLCRRPWIRYERVELEAPKSTKSNLLMTLYSLDNPGCQDFCTAVNAKLVYLLKGERDIEIYNINDGREGSSFTLEGTGRIRKIECTADGKMLAVVWEDLKVSLYSVSLDELMRLTMLVNIYNDQCSSVRFGGISLFSGSDRIIWQRQDGSVVNYVRDRMQETKEHVGKQLVGANECGLIWKAGRMYSLALYTVSRTSKKEVSGQETSGCEIVSEDARINDAVLKDGYVYVAAENQKIMLYDYENGNHVKDFELTGESVVSLVVNGEAVYGADRYGSLVCIEDDILEYPGRITQGENILDINTRLINLHDGRMAFVSMQRRSVLMKAEISHQDMRLMRVCPGKAGNALIWDDGDELTVVTEDNNSRVIPYPKLLLEGRNVNEKNNLKIACVGDTVIYEENQTGIRLISSTGTKYIFENPASEMGGILCDLQYARDSGIFKGTTYRGQYLEIDHTGNIPTRIELPNSDGNVHLMCICGTGCAVLSRSVRIREDAAVSAYMVDMLTMIRNGNILWQKQYDRHSITEIFYDSSEKRLALFHSENRLELLEPGTGKLISEENFPAVHCGGGAAIDNDKVYYVSAGNSDNSGHRLTVKSVHGDQILSLPSQRRIKNIYSDGREIFVQEGNETLYRIYIEE